MMGSWHHVQLSGLTQVLFSPNNPIQKSLAKVSNPDQASDFMQPKY